MSERLPTSTPEERAEWCVQLHADWSKNDVIPMPADIIERIERAIREATAEAQRVERERAKGLVKAARYAADVFAAHNDAKPHSIGMEQAVEELRSAVKEFEADSLKEKPKGYAGKGPECEYCDREATESIGNTIVCDEHFKSEQ